jgi:hypothetical protein
MPLTRLLMLSLFAAGSVVVLADSAKAANTPRPLAVETVKATDLSAQKRKRVVRRVVRAPSTQIACTEYGCHPVPPGCTPLPGRTWRGNYSGFDVVACRRY